MANPSVLILCDEVANLFTTVVGSCKLLYYRVFGYARINKNVLLDQDVFAHGFPLINILSVVPNIPMRLTATTPVAFLPPSK